MSSTNRLTSMVKRFLRIFRVLLIIWLIIWPIVVLTLSIPKLSGSESWGVDIGIYTGFEIDLSTIPRASAEFVGVRDPVIDGRAILGLDTPNLNAWYLFAVIAEIGGVVFLYGLLKVRTIFESLDNGLAFNQENSEHVKKIGFAVIFWNILNPFLQYFGGSFVLRDISFNIPEVNLYPSFEINLMGFFIGFALIVLSRVLQEAADMRKEQQLTI